MDHGRLAIARLGFGRRGGRHRRLPGNGTVDGGPADTELTGDGGLSNPGAMEPPDLILRDGFPAALVDAERLGSLDASFLPFLDESQLQVGDHAEHLDHHPPGRAGGADDLGLKDAQDSALTVDFVDDVEDIAGGSAKPVETDDNQFL